MGMISVPLPAPLVKPQVQLSSGNQEMNGLIWSQHLNHAFQRSQPQIIRSLQHLLQASLLRHQNRLNPVRLGLVRGFALAHDPLGHQMGQLHHVRAGHFLLLLGHLLRDILLFLYGLLLRLVQPAQLARTEAGQIPRHGHTLEPPSYAPGCGLELQPGLGVEQVEGHAGPPPADPEEGLLEGAPPRWGEHGEDVVLRPHRLGLVIVLVVLQHSVDERAQRGLVRGGVGGGYKVLEVVVLLREPVLVELLEALVFGGVVSNGRCQVCGTAWGERHN
ncbi:hypothetical protein PanWU01x14_142400 [Parasponia andersonii]|uniref:Uncharacterized protein n=1 Tax=Parasponia andersonii TaxID=3476 RepID=A0A2P5CLA9_PARAD|nr:hypothetical protein PanWU01x14_142400 [Parasponia andersonii]